MTKQKHSGSKVAPYRAEIQVMLRDGWTHVDILRKLETRHGITASRWTLTRYLDGISSRVAPLQKPKRQSKQTPVEQPRFEGDRYTVELHSSDMEIILAIDALMKTLGVLKITYAETLRLCLRACELNPNKLRRIFGEMQRDDRRRKPKRQSKQAPVKQPRFEGDRYTVELHSSDMEIILAIDALMKKLGVLKITYAETVRLCLRACELNPNKLRRIFGEMQRDDRRRNPSRP